MEFDVGFQGRSKPLIRAKVYIYSYTYTYTCRHKYIPTYLPTYVGTYVHTHTYIYTHIATGPCNVPEARESRPVASLQALLNLWAYPVKHPRPARESVRTVSDVMVGWQGSDSLSLNPHFSCSGLLVNCACDRALR